MKAIKEIQQIQKIIEILRERLDAIQLKIEAREDSFNDRSEKWQESDKGQEFEEKTNNLMDLHQEIENEIENIESALDNLLEITE